MKYLKMSLIFIALLVAGRTFGATTPEVAMGTLNFVPATATVTVSLTESDPGTNLSNESASQFEAVETSNQTLKKKHTISKFRALAGTKRGKNRVQFAQQLQVPSRTKPLTNLDTNLQTNHVPLSRDFKSLPESRQTILHEDLYTIAARI